MPINYNADTRRLGARIKLYSADGSLSNLFSPLGFEVQRVAEDTKFFGQVVCQRLNLKLRPSSAVFDTTKYFIIQMWGADGAGVFPFSPFYINQVNTDEQTGEKSITCYDWIKKTEENTVSQLSLTAPYTIGEFASAIASFYGYEVEYNNISNALINTELTEGANLEGKEKLKDCLQWIAEYLGAIAYVNKDNNLVFRQLNRDGNPLYTVEQANQFSLKTSDTKRLGKVISATELGDNMEAHTTETGSTQIIRNNPIIEVLNAETVVNNLITALGGITITPFEMQFRGNLNFQIGDKLQINTAEGSITSYLLDETITFDGGLISKMRYHWDTNKEGDENANPSTIGEAIFSTSAKVDKINKKIDLVVSDVETNSENIAQLEIDKETISSQVSALQTTTGQLSIDIANIDWRNMFENSRAERTVHNGATTYILTPYGQEAVKNESIITISFEAMSDEADTIIDIYPRYNPESPTNHDDSINTHFFTIGTEWDKYNITLAMPTVSYPWHSWRFRSNGNVTGGSATATVTLRNVKLELGDSISPYTVAPEDIENGLETATDNIATLQSSVSTLTQTADDITATVTSIQTDVDGLGTDLQNAVNTTNTTINSLQQQVNAKVTATDVSIAINEALSNGVDSVTTSTGYRFDKDGLTISKSNSDITTLIDNNGMKVKTQFEDVLTATNSGVNALNLTARNFLIIGTRSRLQDYGTDQTGIFWIGD